MNYFRCTVGGSGGKWKLTVTCTSDYAGLAITCSDGTTTLTKTCPSSSPYTVVFNIPNGGTWTISGTASGQTGTTTVIIPDSATLNPPIPTGSTATPVNVIQTWLHCANIWNKSYTTINQVLADTSTLLALISSNNAADYMARSTNWASSVCANVTAMGYIGNNNYCANKLLANSTWRNAICNSTYFENVLNVKVPTMTSNTAPSGEAFGSTLWTGSNHYYAFDGVVDNANSAYYYNPPCYCGYKFTQKIAAVKFMIRYGGSGATVTSRWQGSNDGTNWVNLSSDKTYNIEQWYTDVINNTTKYQYYRIYITASSAIAGSPGHSPIREMKIYGRA